MNWLIRIIEKDILFDIFKWNLGLILKPGQFVGLVRKLVWK